MTKEFHPETIYILAICYYHNILGWQKNILLGFSGSFYRKILTNFWPTQYVDTFNSFILHIYLYMSASVQFSCSAMSDSLWPHELQHARPPCPSTTPGVHSNPCPLSPWCHQPFHPLLSSSPPALNLSQHQGLFQWVSSLHQVAKVLELQLHHQSFQWTPRTDLL